MKPFFFSLLLVFIVFSGAAQNEQEAASIIKKGDVCPSFSYVNKDGKTINNESFKGKNIVIVFFATWCGPCVKELKVLNETVLPPYAKDENFEILFFGRGHSNEEVQTFVLKNKFVLPFYADPNRDVYSKFASSYIPRCYFVGRDGKVLFASVGYDDERIKELTLLLRKSKD